MKILIKRYTVLVFGNLSPVKWFSKAVIPFLFWVVLSCAELHGQGTDNKLLPVLTLPSPEAASLGKYGVWPVSQYTGVPNISIPVYEININGFTLPITLNYHAGGVKIDDKSAWVGTNWSLSAGGMIGRTVVGGYDENPNGGIAKAFKFGSGIKDFYNLNSSDYDLFINIKNGVVDAESDVYYYNFAGLSGKIMVDSNFVVRTIPASNLKFLLTPFSDLLPNPPTRTANSGQWEIADANGNIYKFGISTQGIEMTNVRQSTGQIASQGTTALYLTQVILANKTDTINFEYDDKNEFYALPYTQTCRAITTVLYHAGAPPNTTIDQGCGTYDGVYNTNQTLFNGETQGNAKRSYCSVIGKSLLKKIKWRGGQIEFKAATVRQDMASTTGKMLDSIVVSNLQGTRVRSTQFQYTYLNGRYYLDSLKTSGSTSSDPLKYGFTYINRTDLPPTEPLKGASSLNSFAQDHWGYYNAATSNANLLPPDASMPGSAAGTLSSDREPDTIAVQTGTLSRITYPTGGYTEFKYEANRYDPSSPANGTGPIIETHASASMNLTQPVGKMMEFDVPFDQNNAQVSMHFNDYAHPPNKRDATVQYVKIDRKLSSGQYQNVYYWDAWNDFPTGTVTPNSRGYYDFDVNVNPITLSFGTYRIFVNDSCPLYTGTLEDCLNDRYPDPDPADDDWIIPRVTATVTYHKYDVTTGALPVGGGLRVKEILSYNNDNTLAGRKKYEYDPGNLLLYPAYARVYQKYTGVLNVCYSEVKLREISSTSQTILGFTQGAAVGYTHVKEKDLDAGNNDLGYTSYNFSFISDSINLLHINSSYWTGSSAEDPSFPVNSFEYKRGLLLSKSTYKKTGTTYIKIDSLDNKYDFNDYNAANYYYRQRNLRIRQMAYGNFGAPLEESQWWHNPTAGDDREFSYATYEYITSWVKQLSSEQITYDQNGANPLSNLTTYYYDNPSHMLPTRVELTKSDGRKMISYTNYPQDYAAGTTFIDDMVAANIIAKPIENIAYQLDAGGNASILKGTITVYKTGGKGIVDRLKLLNTDRPVPLSGFKFSNESLGVLPFTTTAKTALLPDNRYVDRMLITSVSAYGNPQEQQKTDDVKEVYLWGYKGVYPVAKIIGTDYSTASAFISNMNILDNPSSDQQLRDELNKIRTGLAATSAMVMTYTYSPLLGITSETDANGRTTYYEYDGFGRLKLVKNQDGKIIKQYDYQFQKPITQ
ncbi:YD repeat-containing protein [Chitinophaga rupis]|uniref:YD repeat-containing protein n=1 Tax=Chitinophaga rupis TaxID=573321 RepID=A0A1H7S9U8_9BACT|nr:RHS repeat domain-containing protein [Chitinophaga rupis]SEL69263.1 YD repeat-containing protein [Chitinophaga rupis]